MKKLLVSLLAFAAFALSAFQVSGQDAPKSPAVPIEQYERAVPILLKQRAEADASARDWQLQAAMLAAEVESLKKQLAEAQTKLADALKPKAAPVADALPSDKNLKTETKLAKSP